MMNLRLQRLLKTAFLTYANQVIIIIASILVTLKIISYLGPYQFGIYSTILAYTSFFSIFTFSSGVDDLIIKNLADGKASQKTINEYLSTGFFLRMILGAIAFGISVIGAHLLKYEGVTYWGIILFSSGMLFTFNKRKSPFLIDYIVTEKRLPPEFITLVFTLFVVAAKYAFIMMRASLLWFIVCDLLLIVGVSFCFLVMAVRSNHFRISFRSFCRNIFQKIILGSYSLAIISLFIMIFLRIDQIMLGKMSGMAAVGIYNVAVQLVEAFNFVPVIAGALLLPILSRNTHNEQNMKTILEISFRAATWTSIMIAAFYSFFGEALLQFLWGDQFLDSIMPLKVLVWSQVFVFVGTINLNACIAYNVHKYNLALVITQAILNFSLNLIFIPRYGVTGAAVSTTISYGAGFILMWFFPNLRFLAAIIFKETLPLAIIALCLIVKIPAFLNLQVSHSLLILFVITTGLCFFSYYQSRKLFLGANT
jgi:O-antigen/teichoic acid export membrane protein